MSGTEGTASSGRRGPTLFACQKNEGPFLLEWIAYHRAVGFDRVIVLSNDCTDGSDALLDALAENGIVEHHRQVVQQGVPPLRNGARTAHELNLIADGEWVMWIDPDEYVNIHTPNKRINELIDRIGDADGILLNWVFFGDGGNESWPGRHLSEKLTRCSWRFFSTNTRQVKTLFRMSPDIAGLDVHRPYVAPSFLENGRYFVNGAGQPLRKVVYDQTLPNGRRHNKPVLLPRYALAQINHYAVRSRELFAVRKLRGLGGSVAPSSIRHNDQYFAKYNANMARDRSILALAPATDAMMQRLLGLPGVAEANAHCAAHLADLLDRLAAAQPASDVATATGVG